MSKKRETSYSSEDYPYLCDSYDTKRRFCGYWHQIDEILSQHPEKVLEIGIGNGFVANYLQAKGIDVVSVDILNALKPDVIANVLHLPFKNEYFDVVSCCEVLEHLSYPNFTRALQEIKRVSVSGIVLSLPDNTAIFKFDIEFTGIMFFKKMFLNPLIRPKAHVFDGHHYWEIGKTGYSLERIKAAIASTEIKIKKTFRVVERPFQRFFILNR